MKISFSTIHILSMFLIAPLLMQCVASEKDVKNLDLRLRTMDNRLTNVDRDMGQLRDQTGSRAEKNSVELLQKKQAELASSLDRLKTQVLQTRGQSEETSHHSLQLQEESNQLRDSMTRSINELKDILDKQNSKLEELVSRVQDIETQLSRNNTELQTIKEARIQEATQQAKLSAEQAEKMAEEARRKAAKESRPREIEPDKTKKTIKGAKSSPQKSTAATEKDTNNEPGKALYDKGLSLFNDNKFKDAYIAFSEYIEKYSKGEMIANARFWLGDSLYNQKEYELAILEYQKVIADYSKHPKAPAALLKQGLAFEQLKDSKTAKIVYSKLLDEYPNSEQAATARRKIDTLK
ncbi:MAG: tol-pal system protein YbgF [Proteobacteria bacterium]|nr:tol-pal system protein YbgF [Pseudomonadota bacterium]MBU1715915.1 tol-pal system protein YbgF [Pseudomonadota bacterium]